MFSSEDEKKLRSALEICVERYCNSLPTKEELADITFSEKFEKRMEKLIRRQRKFYYSFINTAGKRVTMIALAIIIGLSTVTLSVEAIREPVVRFIIEDFEKFTDVTFYEDSETSFEFVKAQPTYIPEGFVLEAE